MIWEAIFNIISSQDNMILIKGVIIFGHAIYNFANKQRKSKLYRSGLHFKKMSEDRLYNNMYVNMYIKICKNKKC